MLEIARCAASDVPIRAGEVHYRYNGRVYCAGEMRRMFPEVFDPKVRGLNQVLGWGGVVGGPALAVGVFYVCTQAGVRPGRLGGAVALLAFMVMVAAHRMFMAPATEARRQIERIGADRVPRRLG